VILLIIDMVQWLPIDLPIRNCFLLIVVKIVPSANFSGILYPLAALRLGAFFGGILIFWNLVESGNNLEQKSLILEVKHLRWCNKDNNVTTEQNMFNYLFYDDKVHYKKIKFPLKTLESILNFNLKFFFTFNRFRFHSLQMKTKILQVFKSRFFGSHLSKRRDEFLPQNSFDQMKNGSLSFQGALQY